ncbi:hypothetical protein TNCV_1360401 [Trichonephila clavipes]|nr:hypothetical protein TNCV_1360401 [Trichonephila clavipes]
MRVSKTSPHAMCTPVVFLFPPKQSSTALIKIINAPSYSRYTNYIVITMKDGDFDDKWDKEMKQKRKQTFVSSKELPLQNKKCLERYVPLPLVRYVIFDAGVGGRCGRCGHQLCDFGHLRDLA